MSPDAELMLIFGTLHLIAVALGVGLFVMFLRSETTQPWKPPDEEDGGGGGNDRLPKHAEDLALGRPAAARRGPALGAATLARPPARPQGAPGAPPGPRAGAGGPAGSG